MESIAWAKKKKKAPKGIEHHDGLTSVAVTGKMFRWHGITEVLEMEKTSRMMSQPWKCSRPGWAGLGATWDGGKGWTRWSLMSFPAQTTPGGSLKLHCQTVPPLDSEHTGQLPGISVLCDFPGKLSAVLGKQPLSVLAAMEGSLTEYLCMVRTKRELQLYFKLHIELHIEWSQHPGVWTQNIPAHVYMYIQCMSKCIFSAPCWTWLKDEISNHEIIKVVKDFQDHHSNLSVCACGCLKELREWRVPWMKGCDFRNVCKLHVVSNFFSSQSSDIPEGACRPVHAAGGSIRPLEPGNVFLFAELNIWHSAALEHI